MPFPLLKSVTNMVMNERLVPLLASSSSEHDAVTIICDSAAMPIMVYLKIFFIC